MNLGGIVFIGIKNLNNNGNTGTNDNNNNNKGQCKNYVVHFVVGRGKTTILNRSENVKNGII